MDDSTYVAGPCVERVFACFSRSSVFVVVICSSVLVRRDMHSCFLLAEMVVLEWDWSFEALMHGTQPDFKTCHQTRAAGRCPANAWNAFRSCAVHVVSVCLSDAVAVQSVSLCILLHLSVHLSSFVHNIIAIVVLWVTWGCVIYGRLYLGEHTIAQVLVGIVVGCVYGLGWYGLDVSVWL